MPTPRKLPEHRAAELRIALQKHWIGPLPLAYTPRHGPREIVDGRQRLAHWAALGRPEPEHIEETDALAVAAELARRGHFDRACQFVDRSPHAGADASTLRALTGLPAPTCRRILEARAFRVSLPRVSSTRAAGRRIVRRLWRLIDLYEEDGRPITSDDLREAIRGS